MADRVCRWGIVGTAGIARKNWKSIWNAENARLVAVASRDVERSRRYIQECQTQVPHDPAPEAVGGYEALLARDDIDAVYIPLPTGARKPWVLAAAEAGKHVMCEKPCSVTSADLEEMLAACEKSNVQFMDGVMFMHSQRLTKLQEVLADGHSVGDIKRIVSHFSFRGDDDFLQGNIRTSSELEPQGCLGDLGWYNLRIALCALGNQMPKQVAGRILSARGEGDTAVPTEFAGDLFYDNGVTMNFYCSFLTEHQQWTHFSGTKGSVRIDDFVLPYVGNQLAFEVSNPHFDLDGCDFYMERRTRNESVNEFANSRPNAQETNLFRNFSALALSGKPDPQWGQIALKTQQLVDACFESGKNGGSPIALG